MFFRRSLNREDEAIFLSGLTDEELIAERAAVKANKSSVHEQLEGYNQGLLIGAYDEEWATRARKAYAWYIMQHRCVQDEIRKRGIVLAVSPQVADPNSKKDVFRRLQALRDAVSEMMSETDAAATFVLAENLYQANLEQKEKNRMLCNSRNDEGK